MDKFTVEEINLMCIFNTGNRAALTNDLTAGLRDVYEPEMKCIFNSTLDKLATLADDDFAEIGFYAADELTMKGDISIGE
jgi:hypothetical protein